jgi:hypothetical protein
MQKEEHTELTELIEKFLKSQLTPAYLYERLENSRVTDESLWNQLQDLGFFEFFQDLAHVANPFGLLGNIQRCAGKYLLPESLGESLLAGPFFLSRFKESQISALKDLLGDAALELVLSGQKSFAIIPPILQQLTLGVADGQDVISGRMIGVVRRPDCLGYIHCTEERLSLVRENDSIRDISPATPVDRVLPRGAYEVSTQSILGCDHIDTRAWISMVRFLVVAELLGIGEQVLSMTTKYVTERKQFGVPVGCFQAVSHPLADSYLRLQEVEALFYFLGGMLDRDDEQAETVALVSLAAAVTRIPLIVEKCIQLHGGIGFTWEFPLHLYLRRAMMLQSLYRLTSQEYEKICREQALENMS